MSHTSNVIISEINFNSDIKICNELEENEIITTISVEDFDNCLQGNCGPYTFDIRGPPMIKYEFITQISQQKFKNISCHLTQCFDIIFIGQQVISIRLTLTLKLIFRK